MRTEGVSKYRVQFIGRGGQFLTESAQPSVTYAFKEHEGYVCAGPVPGRPSSAHIVWAAPITIAGLVGYGARKFRRRRRKV